MKLIFIIFAFLSVSSAYSLGDPMFVPAGTSIDDQLVEEEEEIGPESIDDETIQREEEIDETRYDVPKTKNSKKEKNKNLTK